MHCSTPANGRFQRQQVLITWVRCDCVIVTAISGDRVIVALTLLTCDDPVVIVALL